MKIILIKYGELTTKKDNRKLFINILYNNIKRALENYNVKIIKNRVRMFIETEDNIDEIVDILKNIFGIHSIVIATRVNTNIEEIEKEEFLVKEIKTGERSRKAPLPFTTSTLQQEASKALNFPISKTMRIAQQLYEGVDIKGQGTVGIITYLRTDSVRISEEADEAARAFISESYGEEYLSDGEGSKKSNAKIQDAHEAIRPTDINRIPSEIKESLSRDQFRLYQLIWNRFMASRMAPAKYENTSVKIAAGDYRFNASASKIAFDGFLSVYNINNEKSEGNVMLKSIDEDTKLTLNNLEPKQHFTQPPAHYTEASLVKTLEEFGIGRPSTYAPTISTITARRYVVKEKKNLYVTELGEAVNNMMKKAFASIVDVNFTAMMEGLLDMVEEGKVHWSTRFSSPELTELRAGFLKLRQSGALFEKPAAAIFPGLLVAACYSTGKTEFTGVPAQAVLERALARMGARLTREGD